MAVPFSHKVTPVMFAGSPVPETDKVKPISVMVEVLELIKTSCWTVTPEAPESWFEFPGGLVPWDAETVT